MAAESLQSQSYVLQRLTDRTGSISLTQLKDCFSTTWGDDIADQVRELPGCLSCPVSGSDPLSLPPPGRRPGL